jgi:DsbC/DsbD-like thiol-disulfide interchange protein
MNHCYSIARFAAAVPAACALAASALVSPLAVPYADAAGEQSPIASVAGRAGAAAVVQATAHCPGTVRAGQRLPLSIDVIIAPGYHIYTNRPGESFVIPTGFRIGPLPRSHGPALAASVAYPAANSHVASPGGGGSIATYTGLVTLRASVEIPGAMRPGRVVLPGLLHVQACNDTSCLRPADIPVSATFTVLPAH